MALRNGIGTRKLQATVDSTTYRIVEEMVGLGIHGANRSEVAAWVLRAWIWAHQEQLERNGIKLLKSPSSKPKR